MSRSICLPGPPSKASCIFVLISALLSFLCLGGGLGGLPPSAHAPLSNRGHVAHYPAFLSNYLRRWFKASRRWMLLDTHQWHPGSCYVSCLFLAFPGSDSSLVYLYIDSWTRPVRWPPLLSPSCAPHFSFTFLDHHPLFLHSLLSHLSEHLCCKLTKDEPESDHMTHRSVLMSPAISPVYTDTIIDPFPALTMNAVFWLAVFWCICTDLNITVWSVFVLCVSLKSKLSNLQHQEDPRLYCWYQHCLTDRF